MTRISNFLNKTSAPKTTLQPGLYYAVVKKVEEPDIYGANNALDIYYELTPVTGGDTATMGERFFTNDKSPRWKTINYVMDAVGVGEDPMGFIGCELQVKLAFEVKKGGKFLNIVEYILPDDRPDEEGGSSDATDA